MERWVRLAPAAALTAALALPARADDPPPEAQPARARTLPNGLFPDSTWTRAPAPPPAVVPQPSVATPPPTVITRPPPPDRFPPHGLAAYHGHEAQAGRYYRARYVRPHASSGRPARSPASWKPASATDPSYGSLPPERSFASDEEAARYYVSDMHDRGELAVPRASGGKDEYPGAPDTRHLSTEFIRATGTRLVRLRQTHQGVDVHGAGAVIELTDDRQLLSFNMVAADMRGVAASEPELSKDEAYAALRRALRASGEAGFKRPAMRLFPQETDGERRWRLAYVFEGEALKPPAAPPSSRPELFTYLVDAADGALLTWWRETANAHAPDPTYTPVDSWGTDDDDKERNFETVRSSGHFVLMDALRRHETRDLGYRSCAESDIGNAGLGEPIRHVSERWGPGFSGAVSAHANAAKVYDFYNDAFKRKGIYDDRTVLVSLIRCSCPSRSRRKEECDNAFWHQGRMFYGQTADRGSRVRSWARYTSIVGHEMTHGVVSATAKLVNEQQSGSLNESLADVMGVLINNWEPGRPDGDPAAFDWRIQATEVLRDVSKPSAYQQPEHMSAYWAGGGVHHNSGILNRAAYLVFTSKNPDGRYVLPWKKWALLYYLAMLHLQEHDDFSAMRQSLLDVAHVRYADEQKRREVQGAIEKAFDRVGIR